MKRKKPRDADISTIPISVFPMGNDPYVQQVFPIPDDQGKTGSSKQKKKKKKKDKKRNR